MAAGFAPGSQAALNYLNQLLVARHVDPRAAGAVFSVEGASGGIGDGGHAFGPGQFNNAGGVWTGRYAGMSPQQINQIAWSQQGLTELADRVSKVAGGLKGANAVRNIVQRFERPQDPAGEVSKALQRLGLPVNAAWGTPGQGKPQPGRPPAAPGLAGFSPQLMLSNLIQQQNAYLGGSDYTGPNLAQQMQQFNLLQQSKGGGQFFNGPTAKPSAPYKGTVKFLGATGGEDPGFLNALGRAAQQVGGSQVRIISGYRSPEHNKAVGGAQNSLHTRGMAMDGEVLIGGKWVPLGTALKPYAGKYGLRSGDTPGFFNGKPDPNHVDFGLRA